MRTASIFLKKKMSNDIAHFLDNSQIHYLKKVMKIKYDEKFYTFDGNGLRALCKLTSDSKLKVLEINQVAAYFNYANRTVLGLGVSTKGDIIGLSPNNSDDENSWSHQ